MVTFLAVIKFSLPPLQKKLFLTDENVVSGMDDMIQDRDLWVSKEHRKRERERE